LKERLLRRLETEDLNTFVIPTLSTSWPLLPTPLCGADICHTLRAPPHNLLAPAERHEFEGAIEVQLEELFRALPADVSAVGLSARFSEKLS